MDTRPGVVRSPVWAAGAIAFAVVGLATLPIAPKVWLQWILPRLQPHVTLWWVGAGGAILAGLCAWAWSAGAVHRAPALAALAAVMGVYLLLLFTVYRHEPPAKKWHLLQYGLLAGLTLQAVHVEQGDWRGPVVAALFLFVIGTADEVSQKFIPMRTFRWLDLVANYIGASLGAAAWLAASPHSPRRRQDPHAERSRPQA
jgi:VanZ family protein